MTVRVNGEEIDIPESLCIADFLKQKDIIPEIVVVEHNHRIINRRLFDSTKIASGDNIEIVRFIGGG